LNASGLGMSSPWFFQTFRGVPWGRMSSQTRADADRRPLICAPQGRDETAAHARARPRPSSAGVVVPPSSAAIRANRSSAHPGTRAFRGINGCLPAPAFAGAAAHAGPFHLFHVALAPVRRRAALGVARRPTNAGQESAHPSQRRGTSTATNGSLGNWSRGGQLKKAWKACAPIEHHQGQRARAWAGTRPSRGRACRPDFGVSPGRIS